MNGALHDDMEVVVIVGRPAEGVLLGVIVVFAESPAVPGEFFLFG